MSTVSCLDMSLIIGEVKEPKMYGIYTTHPSHTILYLTATGSKTDAMILSYCVPSLSSSKGLRGKTGVKTSEPSKSSHDEPGLHKCKQHLYLPRLRVGADTSLAHVQAGPLVEFGEFSFEPSLL